MHIDHDADRDPLVLRAGLTGLLVVAFLTGGSSQVSGWDDTVVQLMSLPILAFAMWRIACSPSVQRVPAIAVVPAVLLVCVPLVQLLPIPQTLWSIPEARSLLGADLAAVGVESSFHWSLAPEATRTAILFLLPPLAAFAATLATGPRTHRWLMLTVMLLAVFSLLLAVAQIGVPRESLLNPFPRWASLFNGVFANPNHQGISLVLACIIATTGALKGLERIRDRRGDPRTVWLYGFVALLALCALPLTDSRASILIGVSAVGALPFALGFFGLRKEQRDRRSMVGLAGAFALLLLGAWGAAGWMQADEIDQIRAELRSTTFELGVLHAPLGTGVGAFVPAFEQTAPQASLRSHFTNHAHNEYAQWWMEAGWLGVLTFAAVLGGIAWAAGKVLGTPGRHREYAIAALFGLVALLMHSWVDYPLRTVSLATVAAVLSGVLFSHAGRSRDLGANWNESRPSHAE